MTGNPEQESWENYLNALPQFVKEREKYLTHVGEVITEYGVLLSFIDIIFRLKISEYPEIGMEVASLLKYKGIEAKLKFLRKILNIRGEEPANMDEICELAKNANEIRRRVAHQYASAILATDGTFTSVATQGNYMDLPEPVDFHSLENDLRNVLKAKNAMLKLLLTFVPHQNR